MGNSIKQRIKESKNPFVKLFCVVLRKGKHAVKLLVNPKERAQWNMEHFKKGRVQQTTQLTWEDRYPDIFAACKEFFDKQNRENIRILSYGCCTGEEVVTLRKYFPKAEIIGAEINRHSLKVCRKRRLDKDIHFVYSTPKNISKYGPFDAVFCMAVLERLPMYVEKKHITDLSDMYPFEKYNEQIHEIDGYVKNKGLLIAHFSHYDLMDTDLASKYSEYEEHGYKGIVFDVNSKMKKDHQFQQSIYEKTGV